MGSILQSLWQSSARGLREEEGGEGAHHRAQAQDQQRQDRGEPGLGTRVFFTIVITTLSSTHQVDDQRLDEDGDPAHNLAQRHALPADHSGEYLTAVLQIHTEFFRCS